MPKQDSFHAISLVLGSGGAQGYAHIGVIDYRAPRNGRTRRRPAAQTA
jgi:hypothetical protein